MSIRFSIKNEEVGVHVNYRCRTDIVQVLPLGNAQQRLFLRQGGNPPGNSQIKPSCSITRVLAQGAGGELLLGVPGKATWVQLPSAVKCQP